MTRSSASYSELGRAIRPEMRTDDPAGQWNDLDVKVEDGGVSTWLNGRPTVDRHPMPTFDPKFPDAGGVELQAHAAWKKVLFGDIRLRESPQAAAGQGGGRWLFLPGCGPQDLAMTRTRPSPPFFPSPRPENADKPGGSGDIAAPRRGACGLREVGLSASPGEPGLP